MPKTTRQQYTFKSEEEMFNYAARRGWTNPLMDLVGHGARMSEVLENLEQEEMKAKFLFDPSRYRLKDVSLFTNWISNLVLLSHSEEKLFPNLSINKDL